jgi:drug/metabolite transporter (DMT)-like permease
MKTSQILGISVLVLGAVLLGFAYNASEAPVDQLSNTLTGRYTDRTMWYILAGIVAVAGGGFLAIFGKRI